jgi:hypothetical protein
MAAIRGIKRMASTTYYITGKANWAKVFAHNKDKNEDFHGLGGAYVTDLVVDKEELDGFVATGARTTPKTTDEGMSIKFKRKHSHPTITAFGGPPQVVDAEKNLWDGTLIGNGSTVEIAYTVYDTKMGKGTRMEGMRVIEHVALPEMDGEGAAPSKLPF